MRLFACSVISGSLTALNAIDPLDCLGDGSENLLQVGDRAVVTDAYGTIAFYILKSDPGHTNDGLFEVIPVVNSSDFYWECCGYTKQSSTAITDIESGTKFIIPSGSRVPPKYFSGSNISYGDYSCWELYPFFYDSNWETWQGFALKDGVLHTVYGNQYERWDSNTEEFYSATVSNSSYFDYTPSHCLESNDGSEYIISDIDNASTLSVFNFNTLQGSNLPFTFNGSDTSWLDVLGDNNYPEVCKRYGKWFYSFRGEGFTGFCRVDVLTGDVYKLTSPPIGIYQGATAVDFYNNYIYHINSLGDRSLIRYNISSDSWETLAVFPGGSLGWCYPIFYSDSQNCLVVPTTLNTLYIYDISLNTWFIYGENLYTFKYTSPSNQYRGLGLFSPFGYSSTSARYHGVIKESTPFQIEKV